MGDRIFDSFLKKQLEDGLALAAHSDLLVLKPLTDKTGPPCRYIATLSCNGLVRTDAGKIVAHNHFAVGIFFPPDYLRHMEPARVLTLLEPPNVFHPNIRFPFICVGHLAPGTSLPELIYQVYEILSYNKVTMREDDALNGQACIWARAHQSLFPLDKRPLRRRVLGLEVEVNAAPEGTHA